MTEEETLYSEQTANPDLKTFGKNLKEVCNALELSQARLAERTGLTPAAISQIMGGSREPSFSSIVAILQVIPVTFERLMRK